MDEMHEEEMHAQFRLPIGIMLRVLGQIQEYLLAAQQSAKPEDCHANFDRAMSELMNLLDLSRQVAFVITKNGRSGFIWIDRTRQNLPAFRWLVCYPDGTYGEGQGNSTEECEKVITKKLAEPPKGNA